MCLRLSSSLYWPDYKDDLSKSKLSCSTCMTSAPSNPAMPPQPPVAPLYPFQSIVCDFFTLSGNTYAAIADRYSNWLSILRLKRDTSQELITALRNYFSTFGIAELFSSDGASIFTSNTFNEFCSRWGIQQRISSAYFPRSNKRAEVAVKSAKRMIRDSLGPGGTLDTDALARALLAHRNTPDPLTGLSPAQVVFGRTLRDFLPCSPGKYQPRPEWRITAEQRELAHARRHVKTGEALSLGSKQLSPLIEGDLVSVQDQSGTTPRRWSKTGKVLEALGHDSYLVRMDGSNRVTQRNRQFLRRIQPFAADTDVPLLPAWTPPSPCPAVPVTDIVDPVDLVTAPELHHIPDPVVHSQPAMPDQARPIVTASPHSPDPGPAVPLPPVVPSMPNHLNPDMSSWSRSHLPNSTMSGQPGTVLPGSSSHLQPGSNSHFQPPARTAFLPPPPGVPHYEELKRIESEARRQVEASRQLTAYLASYMTNTALSSWWVGGIQSTQPCYIVYPNPM